MDAGELDRRITLRRVGEPDVDGAGNPIPGTGQNIALTRWAKYTPVSDRERIAAKEVSAEYTARFVIHWSQAVRDVSPKWWLSFEGRDYDITGVKEVRRRETIEITASARTD
jgi:SPP1 family predicted phage head-tail adaptor